MMTSHRTLRTARALAAVCVGVAVTGCAGLFENQVDYKASAKARPLELPPELTQPAADDRFLVPESGKGSASFSEYAAGRRAAGDASPVAGTAAPMVLPPVGDKLSIARDGSERWLVVPGTPDQVWSKLKEFWEKGGYSLVRAVPELGVMETDWVEERAKVEQKNLRSIIARALSSFYSTPERDKFRTRLEVGPGGVTEIYVSHRGMYEIYIDEGRTDTRWQPRPADRGMEVEMLRRIAVFLGADEKRAESVVALGGEKSAERARLVEAAAGGRLIELDDRFDRAWRRVSLALDRSGFTVEDRDRSKGLFFVRYVDPNPEAKSGGGFLSWLAFWKDDAEIQPQTQFRLVVSEEGAVTRVRVQSKDGAAALPSTAGKILGLLHEQLK